MFGLVSAKGSPGVTTAAAALAAAAGDGLLVELDPSGGNVECWTGVPDEPGLIRVAQRLRRSHDAAVIDACVNGGPSGIEAILAPTSGPLAESTIAATGGLVSFVLPRVERTVVIDGGRWSPVQPTASRLVGCEVVGVVCRPTVEGVELARWLVKPLQVAVGAPVVVVLVGDRPYGAREVGAVMGAPVAGVLPWDSRAVAVLFRSGSGRGWSRTRLARSARSCLEGLTAFATPGRARSDA